MSLLEIPIDYLRELVLFQVPPRCFDLFFALELLPADVEKVAKEYPMFFWEFSS